MTAEQAIIVLNNRKNYSQANIIKAKRIIISFIKNNENIFKAISK